MPRAIAAPAAALLALAGLAGPAAANPQWIYANPFGNKDAIGPEWNKKRYSASAATGGYLGRFGSENVKLTVGIPTDPGPDPDPDPDPDPWTLDNINTLPMIGPIGGNRAAAAWVYTVRFDLFIIDSWDGYGTPHGDDSLTIKVNGTTLFHEYFSNHQLNTNFRRPDVGPVNILANDWNDTIYRGVTLNFLVAPGVQNLHVNWIGDLSQSVDDESWGLDNVHVLRQRVVVPAPATAVMMSPLALLAARRRR